MSFQTVINIDRFKKGAQGLIEFANLIEQSDPKHREMILNAVEKADPRFLMVAMKKVVFFDELTFLEDAIVAEIFSKVSPKVLAYALQPMPDEFRQKMLTLMGHRGTKMIQEEEQKMGKVPESFSLGAQKQVLKIARGLEAQNKFIFEVADCPRFHKKKKVG